MENLTRNPNLSSELGYKIKKIRKIAEICRKIKKNSVITKLVYL